MNTLQLCCVSIPLPLSSLHVTGEQLQQLTGIAGAKRRNRNSSNKRIII
jgi:hypothetical protein